MRGKRRKVSHDVATREVEVWRSSDVAIVPERKKGNVKHRSRGSESGMGQLQDVT